MAGDQHLDEGWSAHVPSLTVVGLVLLVVAGAALGVWFGSDVAEQTFSEQPPQTSFAFAYDERAERLTVEHAGGETIDGERLFVVHDGELLANFAAYETIRAGDETVVEGVARGDEVSVVWIRAASVEVLARWQ